MTGHGAEPVSAVALRPYRAADAAIFSFVRGGRRRAPDSA